MTLGSTSARYRRMLLCVRGGMRTHCVAKPQRRTRVCRCVKALVPEICQGVSEPRSNPDVKRKHAGGDRVTSLYEPYLASSLRCVPHCGSRWFVEYVHVSLLPAREMLSKCQQSMKSNTKNSLAQQKLKLNSWEKTNKMGKPVSSLFKKK